MVAACEGAGLDFFVNGLENGEDSIALCSRVLEGTAAAAGEEGEEEEDDEEEDEDEEMEDEEGEEFDD